MKRLCALLMITALLCASCTALPAEERAFAVVLCVEKGEEGWQVHGRIPTYQTGGGYLTVSGEGGDLSAALRDMEASAPMQLHLSQLRLLVLDEKLAASSALAEALQLLADRPDMRLQCAVALTDSPVKEVADALKPSAGARLSKAIDVLLDTRVEQGAVLPAELADVIRMGQRQSPVLTALTLEEKTVNLSGGYAMTAELRLAARLDASETALLSLLMGKAKDLTLSLPEINARVKEASAKVELKQDESTAWVEASLRVASSGVEEAALEQAIADACAALLRRLSASGCDVLGLGRKAVVHLQDRAEWQRYDWPSKLAALRWTVAVRAEGAA